MDQLPLALTMGEPAGIGGEIALAAWTELHGAGRPFFVIDDPDRLERLASMIGRSVPVRVIGRADEAEAHFTSALPVLPVGTEIHSMPGRIDRQFATAVVHSIDMAVDLARSGKVGGIVTNPIHKHTLYEAGFRHPGHTEYLAERCGAGSSVMMLCVEGLRVVPVTIHIPLAEVASQLTREKIVACGRTTAAGLARDFGIRSPRLAVAALNPHAGEDGALGREEIEVIAPAIADLKAGGIEASGPHPADTLFHEAARRKYDAVLCMYHDQALIPLKTLDFWGGVNVTLGLLIVRTSPDHGTALDLAGRGIANPASLIAAIRLAGEIAARRTGSP